MAMQRISRIDAPGHWQAGDQEIGYRDFIGFVPHAHLQEDFLTLMGPKGQQMRSTMPGLFGSADRLAVQGDRLVCGRLQSRTHPISDGPLQLLRIQARQEPPIERVRGTEEPTWPK